MAEHTDTNTIRCADKKCPFTGLVSIRGRILTGTVISTKMHRTLVIRREYLHFIPKYGRYERRHKNLSAHVSPAFRVEEGDQVTVGQCRPLSKTVSRTTSEPSRGMRELSWLIVMDRSASTSCAYCQGPARRSSRSPSSKRFATCFKDGIETWAECGPQGLFVTSRCISHGVWSEMGPTFVLAMLLRDVARRDCAQIQNFQQCGVSCKLCALHLLSGEMQMKHGAWLWYRHTGCLTSTVRPAELTLDVLRPFTFTFEHLNKSTHEVQASCHQHLCPAPIGQLSRSSNRLLDSAQNMDLGIWINPIIRLR